MRFRLKYKSVFTEQLVVYTIGVFFSIVAFISYSYFSMSGNFDSQYKDNSIKTLSVSSVKIESYIGSVIAKNRLLRESLVSLYSAKGSLPRNDINTLLNSFLINNDEFDAVFTVWETNEPDGADTLFASVEGNDVSGRYAPYFMRYTEKGLSVRTTEFFDDASLGAFYRLPKTTGKLAVLFPGQNPNTPELRQTLTFVEPIFIAKTFKGIIGVEVNLTKLENFINDAAGLYAEADVFLYAQDATILGASQDMSSIGQKPKFEETSQMATLLSNIRKNNATATIKNNLLTTHVPVQIANTELKWLLLAHYDYNTLQTQLQFSDSNIVQVGFIMIILSFLLIAVYARTISLPIIALRDKTNNFAVGSLEQNFSSSYTNEVGQISNLLGIVNNKLHTLTTALENITNNNLEVYVKPQSENDKLAMAFNKTVEKLAADRAENLKNQKEEEYRNWRRAGIAEINEVLEQHFDSLNDLSFAILHRLINFMGIQQGALFMVQGASDETKVLSLISAIAYNNRKKIHKTIRFGEGLVGTAAKERESILLNKVPDNYLEISSGLGDSKPGGVLIVPILFESVLIGIIELASLKPFEPIHVQFAERAAQSIGASLSSALISQRTNELLERTNKQTEEMAHQEAEMQQSLLGLAQAQEESARREFETQSLIHAIEKSIPMAEYEINRRLVSINNRYLEILERKREHIIGKFHEDICSFANDITRFNTVWETLRKGQMVSYVEKYSGSNGKIVYIQETYSPIFDQSGAAIRVISVGTDVTQKVEFENKIKAAQTDIEQLMIERNELKHGMEQYMQRTEQNTEQLNEIMQLIEKHYIFFEITSTGGINRANALFIQLIGKTADTISGNNLRQFIPTSETNFFEETLLTIQSKSTGSFKLTLIDSAGNLKYVLLNSIPKLNKENKLYKILLFGMDLTELNNLKFNNSFVLEINELKKILLEKEHQVDVLEKENTLIKIKLKKLSSK